VADETEDKLPWPVYDLLNGSAFAIFGFVVPRGQLDNIGFLGLCLAVALLVLARIRRSKDGSALLLDELGWRITSLTTLEKVRGGTLPGRSKLRRRWSLGAGAGSRPSPR